MDWKSILQSVGIVVKEDIVDYIEQCLRKEVLDAKIIQRENDIFPVEVKSETNTTSRSLKKFKELFPDQVKLRVRFSLDNLKLDDDVLNIPLFMADQTDRLIGLVMEKQLR